MKALHMVTWILVIVGALNWGLVGLFDMNVVEAILGTGTLTMVVYILVGVSALVEIFSHGKNCRRCKGDSGMSQPAQTM